MRHRGQPFSPRPPRPLPVPRRGEAGAPWFLCGRVRRALRPRNRAGLVASVRVLSRVRRLAITFDYLLEHRVKLQNIFSSLRLVEIVRDIFGDCPLRGPSKPWSGGSTRTVGLGQGTAGCTHAPRAAWNRVCNWSWSRRQAERTRHGVWGAPQHSPCAPCRSTRLSVTRFPAQWWPAAVSRMTQDNWVSSRRHERTHCHGCCRVHVTESTSFLSVPILISSIISLHFGCSALNRSGDPGFIPGHRDRGAAFFSSSYQDWLQQGTLHWVKSTEGSRGAFLSWPPAWGDNIIRWEL